MPLLATGSEHLPRTARACHRYLNMDFLKEQNLLQTAA